METQVAKTLAQLQERVSYLEDGGRGNNVRIVGVLGNSEKGDMDLTKAFRLNKRIDVG